MNRFAPVCLGVLMIAALALAQSVKPPTYSISGAAPQFTLVYLSGPTQVRPTSPSGKPTTYQFTGLEPGVYTVRPERQNCTYQPAERTVTITNSNVTGIDFTNTCTGTKKGPPGPKH